MENSGSGQVLPPSSLVMISMLRFSISSGFTIAILSNIVSPLLVYFSMIPDTVSRFSDHSGIALLSHDAFRQFPYHCGIAFLSHDAFAGSPTAATSFIVQILVCPEVCLFKTRQFPVRLKCVVRDGKAHDCAGSLAETHVGE